MAGHLSAATLAVLAGPRIRHEAFTRTAKLISPASAETDISSLVQGFGRVKVALTNHNPRFRRSLTYPEVEVRVLNDDSYFTEGVAGAVWGSGRPQAWQYKFTLEVDVSGTATKLVEFTWPILHVAAEPDVATITAAHPLRLWWGRRWTHARDGLSTLDTTAQT